MKKNIGIGLLLLSGVFLIIGFIFDFVIKIRVPLWLGINPAWIPELIACLLILEAMHEHKKFILVAYVTMSVGMIAEAYMQNFYFHWIYMFFIGILSVWTIKTIHKT
jgi:hypothetical protein